MSSAAAAAGSTRNKHSKPSALDDPQLDITKEEFARIREALGKEEFRKLFFDYIDEIQDPENRKIYEAEIAQFEKERGVEVTFIHPQPGFVVKTSLNGERKCFINIASCAEIAPPSKEAMVNPDNGLPGFSWAIPMAQTTAREDIDAKSQRCKVFDVVFHPNALELSEQNKQFRKCLIDTALDAVEREFHVNLDRANLKFPKMTYKGMARPTVIRKLATNATAEEMEPHPLDHICPPKPDENAGKPKVVPMKKPAASKPEYAVPKYVIKHRHGVDLAEYTDELDAKLHLTKPTALVIEIELPLLNSSADCQLDVTGKSLYLLSEKVGAKYRLHLDLPYVVDDKEGTARFDTGKRQMCITLPVVRTAAEDERKMHDMLRNFSREDSGVELHSNSESPVEDDEDEAGKTKHAAAAAEPETDLSEYKSATSDESAATTPNASPLHVPRSFLKNSIHYQLPAKFDCNVLQHEMCFVLHVRNVQADSIATLKRNDSVHLQFASLGSGYYPTYYAFYIQLPSDGTAVNLKIETATAEAWENNLVLNLTFNASCEALPSYLAGIDSNQLKEYKIHSLLLAADDVGTPTAKLAPSMHVWVERSDECDGAVEIGIKPLQKSPNVNCAANTTEDDEEAEMNGGAGKETQKKLNKKQRKRNKKRRSLSESACDDIKAYEAQKQQQQMKKKMLQQAAAGGGDAKDVDGDEEDSSSSPERGALSAEEYSRTDCDGQKLMLPIRKQRSFSECHDGHAGSVPKSILKRFSRYGARPSISDSCSSIDDCSSSAYSCSVDAGVHNFSQSFGGIPEENDEAGLSESCKKTVRFNDHIMKQVFRLDSSILGQRKKNQKRRDRKQKALQRRVSEGDSADYEDNTNSAIKHNDNANHDNRKESSQHERDQYQSDDNKAHGKKHTSDAAGGGMMFEMDDDI